MSYISLDMGSVDIYLKDIAESVVFDSGEADLLESLAEENKRLSGKCEEEVEKKFMLEAEAKYRELAAWFREKQP